MSGTVVGFPWILKMSQATYSYCQNQSRGPKGSKALINYQVPGSVEDPALMLADEFLNDPPADLKRL
jgi:hypothetical protein